MAWVDSNYRPHAYFGTGTLVWQTYPHLESLGSTTMWSDPLTPDQVEALKYFSMTQFIGGLLVSQGERMLTGRRVQLFPHGHTSASPFVARGRCASVAYDQQVNARKAG